MSDTYVPAGGMFGSLNLIPLPESAIPLEAIVFVKALDENGEACWYTRYTEDLSAMEAVGVLDVAHQLAKDGAIDGFICESEDEEDEEY
jgi:hypothetical protein